MQLKSPWIISLVFTFALLSHMSYGADDGDTSGNTALKKSLASVFAFIKNKEFNKAEKELVDTVIPANKDQWIVHYLLANAYLGQDKTAEALDAFEKALSHSPPEKDRKNISTAIAKLRPVNAETNIEIATLEYMIRQLPTVTNKLEAYDKVLSKARDILHRDPDNIRVWHYQAKIALTRQNKKLAYEAGQNLLRLGAGTTTDAKLVETLVELNIKGLLHPTKEYLEFLDMPETLTLDLSDGVKLELVAIPPGTFQMGSPETESERDKEREKQHLVKISRAFYMGKYAVTQEQYEAVIGYNPSYFSMKNGGAPKNPAENVTWFDAVKFCEEMTKKVKAQLPGNSKIGLPSEAQWEYACRAGTTTPFNFEGKISVDKVNYNSTISYDDSPKTEKYRKKTMPVGSFPPNKWGLYDMHGNVSQWCQDWYDDDYYTNSPKDDPVNQTKGKIAYRVCRGGSWGSIPV